MNNNFYDIPVDWYKEFNDTFNTKSEYEGKENNSLVSPKEGLLRGNLFKNLYSPYKNYNYGNLTPSNNREEILYNLLKYKFAIQELDLYLDIYPTDINIINLYNKYLKDEKKLSQEYEKKYGPLTIDSEELPANKWIWISSPWPWEGTK